MHGTMAPMRGGTVHGAGGSCVASTRSRGDLGFEAALQTGRQVRGRAVHGTGGRVHRGAVHVTCREARGMAAHGNDRVLSGGAVSLTGRQGHCGAVHGRKG